MLIYASGFSVVKLPNGNWGVPIQEVEDDVYNTPVEVDYNTQFKVVNGQKYLECLDKNKNIIKNTIGS